MRWWDGNNWTTHVQPVPTALPVYGVGGPPRVGSGHNKGRVLIGVVAAAVSIVVVLTLVLLLTRNGKDAGGGGGAWSDAQQVDRIEVGVAPEFPASLDHWELMQAWDVTPRAFESQQTAVPGPDFQRFPATMNGCDKQRFLVRWRVLNANAEVIASLADANGAAVNTETGSAGWMDLDGCLTPQFEFAESSDEANLTDVVVSVQRWYPAP